MFRQLPFPFLALLGLFPLSVRAEESVLQERPGHSVHGQSFDEGPRRFAKLMGGTGNVHFPVTTTSPESQQFFDQGVGQLHGFWYYEAERSFRQVLHLDPNCVMAYWGMAMANVENEPRAREIIAKGVKEIEKGSEKEKMWIRSLENYFAETKTPDERKAQGRRVERDWEAISLLDTNDLEARAFVIYQTWWNSSRRSLDISSPLSLQSMANDIFAKTPLHPAHHFMIHLWDAEGHKNGIPSAALCGPSAPQIAHMWHMPGHIYTGLQRWNDAAWQQDASTRVDHRHMMEDHTMPDQIHNYAHNSEWMIRNWNHVGRAKESLQVAKNMMEEPRIPRSRKVAEDPDQKWDAGGSAYALGRQRLVETLLRWELWDDVLALASTSYLDAGQDWAEKLSREHLLALAYNAKGNAPEFNAARQRLADLLTGLRQERTAALEQAEMDAHTKDSPPDATNKALADASARFTDPITRALDFLDELSVLQALAENRREEALELRKKLKRLPDERRILLDLKLGNTDDAVNAAQAFANNSKNQVLPAALLLQALQAANKADDAAKQFENLRNIAGYADPDLPIFLRVHPTTDWHTPPPPASDLGPRPDLDSLGPLLWKPTPAPAWHLATAEGQPVGSDQYAGKPYVLIFFLGKGCPHCVRQLQAFEPQAAAFTAAGLPIVAISTDTPLGVAETIKLGREGGSLPFPIISDSGRTAFRDFNAFDEFENTALHGTFLIDAAGLVRWQHISYEPFMRADFLLQEAQRLLKFSGGAPSVAGQ